MTYKQKHSKSQSVFCDNLLFMISYTILIRDCYLLSLQSYPKRQPGDIILLTVIVISEVT